jgi:SAM-dependent methyltransferase
MLGSLLRQLRAKDKAGAAAAPRVPELRGNAPAVLNVGGHSKASSIPPHYDGWQHVLLDIDATSDADIVCDARELPRFEGGLFDAVYCAHNLEHFYQHDVPRVLGGFLHVLKPDGFAEIRVPDLEAVFRKVASGEVGLEDELYRSTGGPIAVIDIIYGWSKEIEASGRDFYAHKTGFTATTLMAAVRRAGFKEIWMVPGLAVYELRAFAFRAQPTPAQRKLYGIPLDGSAA